MPTNPPLSAAPLVTNTTPAKPLDPSPLIGTHVRLDLVTPSHHHDLWNNIGVHTDLWTWWPDGPYGSEAEFSAEMAIPPQLGAGSDLAIYAVTLLSGPEQGKAVGLAFGLSEERESNRIAELGLFYGPLVQGSRAGTEAVYLLAGKLFELNHRRMTWKTNSLNLASRSAAERLGFVLEGVMRQNQIVKGRSRDTAFYGIIDSEWPLCKRAFEEWLKEENFDEQGRQKRRLQEVRESLK